jgi:hypothetical protein
LRSDYISEGKSPFPRGNLRGLFGSIVLKETELLLKRLANLAPNIAMIFQICLQNGPSARKSRAELGAYREFEDRMGAITKTRGAKTALIEQAIERLPSTFGIVDIERTCSSISRDMIRVV